MKYPKNFYPTPPDLADLMVSKIKNYPRNILEPSAGDGALIEAIKKKWNRGCNISAIEIDKSLRSILIGNEVRVIDSDFLRFAGPDKFDLIIMNPPFDNGVKHILKAIDIMYSGQIICLLNAETIRNPHTNNRKLLSQKLSDLSADIEYVNDAFLEAERRAKVDVAIVDITIDQNVETELFDGLREGVPEFGQNEIGESKEVANKRSIDDIVADYNQRIHIGQETLLSYYRNYKKIGQWIRIDTGNDREANLNDNLTQRMQKDINHFCRDLRKSFWRKLVQLKEVAKYLTNERYKEFYAMLQENECMDFTEPNVRQFVINIIENFPKTIEDAILEIFDMFTIRHAWDEELRTKNIHYFNGWKTNKAFKCNKKIIIPIRSSFGEPFQSFGKWSLDYDAKHQLNDIDTVMNHFSGELNIISMSEAISNAFSLGQTKKIDSTNFQVDVFKKGTAHLTFKDENVLRRFNIAACKGKNWLPQNYGEFGFKELTEPEKQCVREFEGEKNYKPEASPLCQTKRKTRLLLPIGAKITEQKQALCALTGAKCFVATKMEGIFWNQMSLKN